MQQFERYCREIREIDGVKTCIVSPEYLDDICRIQKYFPWYAKAVQRLLNS